MERASERSDNQCCNLVMFTQAIDDAIAITAPSNLHPMDRPTSYRLPATSNTKENDVNLKIFWRKTRLDATAIKLTRLKRINNQLFRRIGYTYRLYVERHDRLDPVVVCSTVYP